MMVAILVSLCNHINGTFLLAHNVYDYCKILLFQRKRVFIGHVVHSDIPVA